MPLKRGLKMREEIRLANDAVFVGTVLITDRLFLYMYETDMRTVFNALIEPENTGEIIYKMINGTEVTYEGYTKLVSVRDEGNGLITAVLIKERV